MRVRGTIDSSPQGAYDYVVHGARTAEQYGIEITGEIKVNFKTIMERMRKIRAHISENDSAKRFSTTLGVDMYMGNAKLTTKHVLTR